VKWVGNLDCAVAWCYGVKEPTKYPFSASVQSVGSTLVRKSVMKSIQAEYSGGRKKNHFRATSAFTK